MLFRSRYAQLARDSLSSGDRVMAENYLQHAEHYNRIIAAAMLQQAQFSEQQRREWDEEGGDNEGEEGDENASSEALSDSTPKNDQHVAQPQNSDVQQPNNAQNTNRERNNFQNRQDRPERQPRPERNAQDRNTQDRNTQDRGERQPRAVFVAPIDDSQPEIEGTPVEFADAESAGLARTLGLSASRVEAVQAEQADVAALTESLVPEEAPRAPRPRRAPRKLVEKPVAVEATPENSNE